MSQARSIGPNTSSQYYLERAVDRSRRVTGVQLPIGFICRDPEDTSPAPLVRMVQGGRGGAVRLKLYLCLNLVATKSPHTIRDPIPGRVWASMLALPDAEGRGARRV